MGCEGRYANGEPGAPRKEADRATVELVGDAEADGQIHAKTGSAKAGNTELLSL